MTAPALAAPPIALEVARANATYYLRRYTDHHIGCPKAEYERCDECESRALDMVAADRHCKRLEAASIHSAACRYCRQGLRCSTASDLAERVKRLEAAA